MLALVICEIVPHVCRQSAAGEQKKKLRGFLMKKLFSIVLLLSSAGVMASATGSNGLPDGSKCRFATDCASGICTNALSGGLAGGSYCASQTSGESGAGVSAVIGGLLADGQHCLTNRQCASGICSSALS